MNGEPGGSILPLTSNWTPIPDRPRMSVTCGTTRTPGISAAARYSAALMSGGATVSLSMSPIVVNASWSGLCPAPLVAA